MSKCWCVFTQNRIGFWESADDFLDYRQISLFIEGASTTAM